MTLCAISPTAAPAAVAGSLVPSTTETFFTTLYSELCRLAQREVWRNGAHGVLDAGAIVHEAWLDIRKSPAVTFDEPGKFLGYASRMMRGMVIDRLRARQAQKRGGDLQITSLDTGDADDITQPEPLQDLSQALDHLAAIDPHLASIVDLRFFCGFTFQEISVMRGVSERTIQRQWEKARLLLHAALSD